MELFVRRLDPQTKRQECRHMLLEMRSKAGLNQGELAGLLGVDTSTLRRWEEGRRNPSSAARRG